MAWRPQCSLIYWKALRLDLSYTWSDFEYTEFEANGQDYSGNQLPGIPEHLANLQLNYQHACGFFARWNTRYTGSMQANDGNTTKVDDSVVSRPSLGLVTAAGRLDFRALCGAE